MAFVFYNLTDCPITISAYEKPNLELPALGTIDLTYKQRTEYRKTLSTLLRLGKIVPDTSENGSGFAPDDTTISLNREGKLQALPATAEKQGIVQPDNSSIKIRDGVISSASGYSPDLDTITLTADNKLKAALATSAKAGIVKPDFATTFVNDGVISARLPIATNASKGAVQPDNSTIAINDGIISAVNGGGGFPPDGQTIELTPTNQLKVVTATDGTYGIVKPDNSSITIMKGVLSAAVPSVATEETIGTVKPDGDTITITNDGVISAVGAVTATKDRKGLVQPDGTSISVSDGVISAIVPKATPSGFGIVKPDNSSIKVSNDGVISATAESSLMPWKFILYTGWKKDKWFHVGTMGRGTTLRMRASLTPGGDRGDASLSEFNFWTRNDDQILNHDIVYLDGAFNFHYVFVENKFEIYLWVQPGGSRTRNLWYQLVQGSFIPDGQQVAEPEDTLTQLTMDASAVLARADKFGIVRPDGSTITIDKGVITAKAVAADLETTAPAPTSVDTKATSAKALYGVLGNAALSTGNKTVTGAVNELKKAVDEKLKINDLKYPWKEALYINGWARGGGTYKIGTIKRGSIVRFRQFLGSSGDCSDVDVHEYNIWSRTDQEILCHDKARDAENIQYYYDPKYGIDPKTENYANLWNPVFCLFFSFGSGRHRMRGFWYQVVTGEFILDGSDTTLDAANLPALLPLSLASSQHIANRDRFGAIRTDETTIKINEGIVSAIPATTTSLGIVQTDGVTVKVNDFGVITAIADERIIRSTIDLSEQCDGEKFTFEGEFPGSAGAMVFMNGLKLTKGVNFSITDTTLTLTTTAPLAGSNLEVELFGLGPIPRPDERLCTDVSNQCNGSRVVFTGNFKNSTTSVVYLNGLKLSKNKHYSITETTLTLTTSAPASGSEVIVETYSLTNRGFVDFSSACSGSRLTFDARLTSSATAMVHLNGLKLSNGKNYTITESRLTLTTTPPVSGSVLEVELYFSKNRGTIDLSEGCDGSTLIFAGEYPNSGNATVFLNGLKLSRSKQYSITDTILTLNVTAPEEGSVLEVELS
jgi:hypothetical protein